jgi:ATP-dependent helicase/nuclease subunit A
MVGGRRRRGLGTLMRPASRIPDDVIARQRAAADPNVSAFVAANAGAGKTHVLAQRVINLLLEGVEPEKILCLTFTKAAAANMAKRVFDTLASWTTAADADLDDKIGNRTGGAARRALARRLFARALETPGGLKVQTIHAFCTRLLHQFPFEANVAARFAVLEDIEQSQILEKLTLQVLLEGADQPDSPLGRALSVAIAASADQTFREVVADAIRRRDIIDRAIARAGSLEAALATMSLSLGIAPDRGLDLIEAEIVDGPHLPPTEWPAVAALLASSSRNDQAQGRRLELAARLRGAARVDAYLKVFFTTEFEPRANVLTKKLAAEHPALAQRLAGEQSRVIALREQRNAALCRDRSAALLTVAHEVLRRFDREKRRRGLLDYDDLIDRTLELLTNVDAAWVHYKLDLGIDHLLIDEAQDTSSKQWTIVRKLVAEFTAGAGARAAPRTVFAVGDEKQSIYSFQSAAPKDFADNRFYFQKAHQDAGLNFVAAKFEHSFRSGDSVLGAVDRVFARAEIARSVTADEGGFPPHIALPQAPPSLVEIWEPVRPQAREPIEGWDAPFDTVSETSPRVMLAQRISRTVRRLVDQDAARYGDILILVRQRGELFEAIIRALKNDRIEVAGADRLVLTEHIAVMDLLALADALLLPDDNLALATVLRSPLFGFSDDELFAIAYDRGRISLRAALAGKAAAAPKFAHAAATLDVLERAARRDGPFAFYADLIGAGGARRRFVGRLGPDANDALDEFLNLALDYERREAPSLQGFAAWLREARAEVKRDMEIARDEVRVMTVHGAKGLEAPIVFLADTMTPPGGPRPPRLLALEGGALVWAGRQGDDGETLSAARFRAQQEAEDEYRRLLYVAMTRAADRLIVCGAEGRNRPPERCWYELIREALDADLHEEDDHGETVWRYRRPGAAKAAERALAGAPAARRFALPDWLAVPAPESKRRAPPLAPSTALDMLENDSRAAVPSAAPADRRKALARGRIVHRLLQSLPDISPHRRADAAERFLARAAAAFSTAERAAMRSQVSEILENPAFAPLFAPDSRTEVPIAGRLPRHDGEPVAVSGQIDRLVVTENMVLIADYKTDRTVPSGATDVPETYVAQLALYRAVLERIYSGRPIRAVLVFTEGPVMIELPAALMTAALEKFFSAANAVTGR